MEARVGSQIWWCWKVPFRGVEGDWLEDAFVHNMGDGGDTNFWHHKWCTVNPLAVVSQGSIVYPFKRRPTLKIWVFGHPGLGRGF
jgi:hypothetical protein